jgi:glutamine---fructose-6-phosphate transaminase (isomerizing)
MCGIFGLIAPNTGDSDEKVIRRYLENLFRLSAPRGQEASGIALAFNREVKVYKQGLSPLKLINSLGFKNFMDDTFNSIHFNHENEFMQPVAAIGHCRLVTNGVEIIPGNNQPVVAGNIVGVHNGIVTNDRELWEQHSGIQRRLDIDTEVLLRLIDWYCESGEDVSVAVAHTFQQIVGSASLAFFQNKTEGVVLATNFGSLYFCHLIEKNFFFFASERVFLKKFLASNFCELNSGDVKIVQVKAGTGCSVLFDSLEPKVFSLDTSVPLKHVQLSKSLSKTFLKIKDVSNSLSSLTRCTKCILPSTYPFVDFDGNGVCKYCRNYVPPKLDGREALEKILEKHRKNNGSPDCIVGFSGGRDSSYGLHLLKNELGMEPIAFSYDWGMVTDIGRRNQARLVGKLKIEHIIRAADIPSKRRYIRKNINAWLKRPHLGMVPLFMAGDKFFYDHARQLRNDLEIDLVIWCAGYPLEKMDFKWGFAGIRQEDHFGRLFSFSTWKKIRLALFYLNQYILNPSYLNESMLDSVQSFRSTFINKDDFHYLYQYLEWDEQKINRTLQEEYGWETMEHTQNTWRISDGYTSFINYIYHSMAGFSEIEAFRSNQIRQGLITRQGALNNIAKENQPDYKTLNEFAQQIGINLEEVLTQIDSIKKLY